MMLNGYGISYLWAAEGIRLSRIRPGKVCRGLGGYAEPRVTGLSRNSSAPARRLWVGTAAAWPPLGETRLLQGSRIVGAVWQPPQCAAAIQRGVLTIISQAQRPWGRQVEADAVANHHLHYRLGDPVVVRRFGASAVRGIRFNRLLLARGHCRAHDGSSLWPDAHCNQR